MTAAIDRPVVRPRVFWPLALPFVYGALVFAPMLRNTFWRDDYRWVSHAIRSIRHPEALLSPANTFFRPLVNLTFALNLLLSGVDPTGYYVFNLLLHLANVALVMAVAHRLADRDLVVTTIAGLLFAGGFGNFGETVIWICARTGMMADFLGLGTVLAYWSFLDTGRRSRYALALTLFALALLTKESSAVLLPLLLLVEWVRGVPARELAGARTWTRLAPFGALLAVYLMFQFGLLHDQAEVTAAYVPGWHAVTNYLEYFARMALPIIPSSIMLQVPASLKTTFEVIRITLMIALPLLWLALLASRMSRAVKFGVWWMAITIVPYVFFVFRTSIRYLYTPSIGLALSLALLAGVWRQRRGTPASHPRSVRPLAMAFALALLVQAAVVNVVIHLRYLDQKAQGANAYQALVEEARAAGLE